MITCGLLAIGCATLVVPIFTPPDSFDPFWFGFCPYAVLAAATFAARSCVEQFGVVLAAAASLITGCLYLDAIYFHHIFSWQVVGLVQDFVPGFQLALALPVLVVLLIRRCRIRRQT